MFAVYAHSANADEPLKALTVGDRPAPRDREGWVRVCVKAASINHHDVWSLRGVGLKSEYLPMILGTDAAGIDEEGREVLVHAVIAGDDYRGDETLDPDFSMLSERHQGTFAEEVLVPRRNVIAKPAELSFVEAACLPSAWLTAYRMLFTHGCLNPGNTVLVQGVGGGVATAAIMLARAAGMTVWATSRDASKSERARDLGAHEVFESGTRLPYRVDAVMETVGAATWSHSVRSVKNGGTIVISGATSGSTPPHGELTHIFYRQIRVQGSTMGTRDELVALAQFMANQGLRPVVDEVMEMTEAPRGLQRVLDGNVFGKVVLTL